MSVSWKALARKLLPERLQFGQWVPVYFEALARRKTNDLVASGPFRTMKLLNASFASVYVPKLIGCYERELHDYIEDLIAWQPDLIIDVGAADGYYAVGLARRCRKARVVAFEADEYGRKMLMQTAALNDVSGRIEIKGFCGVSELRELLASNEARTGIVMDCEGGELDLLDIAKIPALSRCAILVETHEFKQPHAHAVFASRFQNTHKIVEIEHSPRVIAEYPYHDWFTTMLPSIYRQLAVYEHRRPINRWMWFVPKQSASKCGE